MTVSETSGPSFELQKQLFPGIVHYDNDPAPLYEKIKRIIFTPIVFIRFILAVSGLLFAYIGVQLIQVIKKPTPLRRRIFHWFGSSGGFIARVACGAKIFYAKNSERNVDLSVEPVVSNHVSFLDAPILYSLGATGFISKASIRSTPLLGKVGIASDVIFVDRSDSHSRSDALYSITERLHESGEKGLIIFPEGTTSNGRYICKFKTGVFRAGLPIRPVVLKYHHRFSNPAWGKFHAIEGLRRVLSQFYTSCEVNILPTYYPTPAEKADPELYANNVRMAMSKHSGIPLCDTTAVDIFEYSKYANGEISWEECLEKTGKTK